MTWQVEYVPARTHGDYREPAGWKWAVRNDDGKALASGRCGRRWRAIRSAKAAARNLSRSASGEYVGKRDMQAMERRTAALERELGLLPAAALANQHEI